MGERDTPELVPASLAAARAQSRCWSLTEVKGASSACTNSTISSSRGTADYCSSGLFRHTPGRLPFVNWIPAASNACWITASVARRGDVAPDSNCVIVFCVTRARSARSVCVHPSSARAALHCSLLTKTDDITRYESVCELSTFLKTWNLI